MRFGVVRFNETKKYIGSISYKTLSSTLKELEADKFHILFLGDFEDLTFCIFCHFMTGTAASGRVWRGA